MHVLKHASCVRPLKDNESGFFYFFYIHGTRNIVYITYYIYFILDTADFALLKYTYEGVTADQLRDDYTVIIIILAIRVRLYGSENTANNIMCVTPVKIP